ncbi:MAG: autorepressor SdpR family transcription factor [Peptococcaceae bacterium]|nr:autorepressor SdpR family transcription factor [Peptococcaceae bacterium]
MAMTETLKALSDPVRRKILDMLKDKQLNAGEIAAGFDLTDATISHHLSVLKNAGLIDGARKGTFIIYSLNTSLFEDVMNWMMNLKGGSDS